MKYKVNFSCGHAETIDLDGPTKERERKIAWYEASGECPECYAKRMEAKKSAGCEARTMHYGSYKSNWFWCATARNSYDAKSKTIVVYIPEAYNGLEELILKMAKNSHENGIKEAYVANATVINEAVASGKIDMPQARTLAVVARKIRGF